MIRVNLLKNALIFQKVPRTCFLIGLLSLQTFSCHQKLIEEFFLDIILHILIDTRAPCSPFGFEGNFYFEQMRHSGKFLFSIYEIWKF